MSIHIGIEPTAQCNLRCTYCYSSSKYEYFTQAARTEDLLRGLDALSQLGWVKHISWSGGEPTLFQDIDLLVQRSKALGFSVSVSTNSSLLFKKRKGTLLIEQLKVIDVLAISLDGADPETHNNLRLAVNEKSSNNFRDVLRFLEWYKAQTEKPFFLKVNTIFTRKNFHAVKAIGHLLQDIPGVLWKLEEFIPRGRGRTNQEMLALERNQFLQRVEEIRSEFPSIELDIRLYDGGVYPFLLLLSNGIISMPEGEKHPAINDVEGNPINLFGSDAVQKLNHWLKDNPWFLEENQTINSYSRYQQQPQRCKSSQ